MKNLTPTQCLVSIKRRGNAAIRRRESRLSIPWGRFSRAMNLYTRSMSEDESLSKTTRIAFGDVFSYWITMSQLIDLNCRSRILWPRKKNELKIRLSEIERSLGNVNQKPLVEVDGYVARKGAKSPRCPKV